MCARFHPMTAPEKDRLTGLMSRQSFCAAVDQILQMEPVKTAEGGFAVICLDVIRFKAINELFGTRRGDRLLQHIASVILRELGEEEYGCRIDADHFAVFMRNENGAPEQLLDLLSSSVAGYDLPFETTFNAGIYVTCVEMLTSEEVLFISQILKSRLATS